MASRAVVLSWLYVGYYAATVVYALAKDRGAPQVIREARWKMRHTDLSFDQLVKELMKTSEEDRANFSSFRENSPTASRRPQVHRR